MAGVVPSPWDTTGSLTSSANSSYKSQGPKGWSATTTTYKINWPRLLTTHPPVVVVERCIFGSGQVSGVSTLALARAQFTVTPGATVLVFADGAVSSSALAFTDVKSDWYKVLGVPPVVVAALPSPLPAAGPNNYVVFGSAARAAAPAFFAGLGSDPEVHGCTVSGAVLACGGGVGSDPRADVFALYAFSQQVGAGCSCARVPPC